MAKRRTLLFILALSGLAACGPETKRATVIQPPARVPALEALPLKPVAPAVASLAIPPPDPTQELIDRVEAVYQVGVADYQTGNLEGARQKLDQALRMLLESQFDVGSSDELSAEFERLVENTYSAELAAVERGDTLVERRYEPSPIESFAGLTFPVDPKVKERVEEELKSVHSDLPLVENEYVDGVISYLQQRGRRYVETILEREGLYKPIIESTLRKEGLPQDLIYLAAGESAFNPLAVSHAGAVGIWQFMRSRSEDYGLKKNRWVDEREDPVKSTEAAAKHLKELYQTFGDWFLARAAYDCGPVAVERAIEKTGYADFWDLRRLNALPLETQNYVPVFLATALIAKNPKAYGFDVREEPPLEPDRVVVSVPTDLRLVAQLIDRPVDDVIKLNPSLLRWTTPGNDPDFVLNLPPGTKGTYEKAIAAIPEDKRVWWRAHKVESGETLAEVARKYKISTVALAEANQLDRDAPVEEGTHLVLPLAPGNEWSLDRVHERGPRRLRYYKVQNGDTLDLIADRYDVSPYELRRWNSLKSSRLTPGRRLKLYVPARGGTGARRRPHSRSKTATSGKPLAKKTSTSAQTAPGHAPSRGSSKAAVVPAP